MIFRYSMLYVEDVPKQLEFYASAFGLETGFLHESNQYGELITGATKLAFSSRTLMRSLGKTPQAPSAKAPVFEIAFETSDVSAAFEKAVAAGAAPLQAPRVEEWGQETAYVSDPEGYLIELCSPVGSGA